ncbi:hypothetical protein BH11ACT8_BH11ACT8_04430 [soil metagenome]
MTTSNTTPRPATITPCPTWCTTDHTNMPPGQGFHAGPVIEAPAAPGLVQWSPITGRLWLTDQPGARPSVVLAGTELTEDAAHELGLALVRAADVLRRARMAAGK